MRLSTLSIAWRNLGRNRRRTALALTAIALGQIIVVAVNGMMAGMFDSMLKTITGPMIGHVQIHHKDWREDRAVDLYIDKLTEVRAAIGSLPGVKSVSPRLFTAVLVAPGEQTEKPADAEAAIVVGVDVNAESLDKGLIGNLQANERPGGRNVVIGTVLARRLGITPGRLIAVIGQDVDEFPVSDLFTVSAVIKSSVDIVESGIVMSLPDAQAFFNLPDKCHEIVVRGSDYRMSVALAEAVRKIPSMSEAEVLTWKEAVPELASMIDIKGYMDLIFVGILFLAAAAGIANTMMMSTFERTREIGMLLALGSGPGRLVRMIVLEAVILGLVGVAIGSVLGTIIVLITSHTGINYVAIAGMSTKEAMDFSYKGLNISLLIYPKLEYRSFIYGLVAVTLTSVLTALWPAVSAARLEPAEAMRT
mgnify:FL=1